MSLKNISFKKLFNKKFIICFLVLIVIISTGIFIKMKFFTNNKNINSSVRYTTLAKADLKTTLSTSGAIKSASSTSIYSSLDTEVKEINVKVGDTVKKGDILAVMDTTDLESELQKLQDTLSVNDKQKALQLEQKKQAYDNALSLYENNQNTDILNAEANVESAKLSLDSAERKYNYQKEMYDNGQISQDEYITAQSNYNNAKTSYENAKASLASSKLNVDESLTKAKNDYEEALLNSEDSTTTNEIANKQKQIDKAVIKAPFDGTITAVNATVGETCSSSLFDLQDLENYVVKVDIDETDISKVEVGQKVNITVDAIDTPLEGEVISVDPVSSSSSTESSSGSSSSKNSSSGGNSGSSSSSNSSSNSTSSDVTFTCEIQIDTKDENLKVGMNAVVDIILDEIDDVYSVSYESILSKNGTSSIYVAEEDDNNKYVVKEIPVTTGKESDINVEIDGSDLKDGMIVLNTPSSYTPGDTVEISKNKKPTMNNK
ncbi:HlyD family secretion protein [Clostridium sp. BJN0001]|uniref:efflux RND transporter periplasmic adaptor subunit n=1 Tax=Clostridium sp. BJN0001 TaxID=2930219 RepID=UPI001FD0EF97|nr:HlyD family secretion protein [Clostridium sp. BJN0001]